jgi:hypothetical protein
MGLTNILLIDYIFSENGTFNNINKHIYSLAQFNNTDNTNLLFNETIFLKLLCIDGTNYQIDDSFNIPINIYDSTINDSIYYGNDI